MLLVFWSVAHVTAQPTRPAEGAGNEGKVVAVVPERVEVAADGTMEVVLTEIGPMTAEQVRAARPERVPVYSVTGEGERVRGVFLENRTDRPVAELNARAPERVVLGPDGVYAVTHTLLSGRAHARVRWGGLFRPGYRSPVASAPEVPVRYNSLDERPPYRGPFVLAYDLDLSGAPEPELVPAPSGRALE